MVEKRNWKYRCVTKKEELKKKSPECVLIRIHYALLWTKQMGSMSKLQEGAEKL